MSNLEPRIQRLLETFSQAEHPKQEDTQYQNTFSDEGERKSYYIVDDINAAVTFKQVDPKSLGYLSIGGADGSEVEYVMRATEIDFGILIEYSDDGASRARLRAEHLKRDYPDKDLRVLQGDAVQRLDDALRMIREKKAGIICSAQGILHELPSRSPAFKSLGFGGLLGKIYKGFRVGMFFSREPCKPYGWPEEVRIRLSGVSVKMFATLAKRIGETLRMNPQIETLANNYVRMNSILAVEVLHKILRDDPTSRFIYELGEQLTSFDPEVVVGELKTYFECTPHFERITTEGFGAAYKAAGVEAIGADSTHSLPIPLTHVRLTAVQSVMPGAPQPANGRNPANFSKNKGRRDPKGHSLSIGIFLNGHIHYVENIHGGFRAEIEGALAEFGSLPNIHVAYGSPRADDASQNEKSVQQLINSFDKKPDYLLGVGTAASQALYAVAKGTIPLVFAGVSDPEASGFLSSSRTPIAGVQYGASVEDTFRILREAFPKSRLVFLCGSMFPQDNQLKDRLEAAIREKRIDGAEILSLDRLPIPSSYTNSGIIFWGRFFLCSNLKELLTKYPEVGFAAVSRENVLEGAVAAIGYSALEIGRLAASKVIVPHFLGEQSLESIGVIVPDELEFAINMQALKRIHLELSEAGRKRATYLVD